MSKKIVFDDKGTFRAFWSAESWCLIHGYSVGSMCGKNPIGIMKGSHCIQKWRNLSQADKDMLHGKITGDMRNGPVTVEIY